MYVNLEKIENKTSLIYSEIIENILQKSSFNYYKQLIIHNLFLFMLEYFYNNSNQAKKLMKSVKGTKSILENWIKSIKYLGIGKFITKMELPL